MKEIKDYLHLYLGCECQVYEKGSKEVACKGRLNTINTSGIFDSVQVGDCYDFYLNDIDIKLILRPLSEVEGHMQTILDLVNKYDPNDAIEALKGMAAAINWLRKNRFDVDGLIEAGLAIDKTKIIIMEDVKIKIEESAEYEKQYFHALKWYKQGILDASPNSEVFEDGVDADFYSGYRDKIVEEILEKQK